LIICLKQIFLSTTKFGGAQKDLGVTAPKFPLVSADLGEPSPESLPLGAFTFVQRARHSENLFFIHNMNSICRLCKLNINFPTNALRPSQWLVTYGHHLAVTIYLDAAPSTCRHTKPI